MSTLDLILSVATYFLGVLIWFFGMRTEALDGWILSFRRWSPIYGVLRLWHRQESERRSAEAYLRFVKSFYKVALLLYTFGLLQTFWQLIFSH